MRTQAIFPVKRPFRSAKILGHRRATVLADVHEVITRKDEGHRLVDACLSDLLVVYEQLIGLAAYQ